MALLRRSRRARSGASGEGTPPPPPTELGLDEQLRAIAAAAAAPEDAFEPALRAILDETGAQAGAICLFDPRYGLMRLAAESGLSDEGCKRLRNVRRADPNSWDIPLHGLLNRRAYLIESAPRNRYVPKLVENVAAMRTVMCVPLYSGSTPLGSLVLIALAPRVFTERDIRIIEVPLQALSAIIEAARKRGALDEAIEMPPPPPLAVQSTQLAQAVAERDRLRAELATYEAERTGLAGELGARDAERASLTAELAVRSGDADRLRAALETAGDERARLGAELSRTRQDSKRGHVLAASLAAAEQERARLAAALEAAAAEQSFRARVTTELEQALAEAGRTVQAMRTELENARRGHETAATATTAREQALGEEIAHLRARLAETEGAVARETELGRTHEQQHERLTLDLRAAEARERQLREELRTAIERTLSDGQEELRQALVAARSADQARAVAVAETDATRAALTSAQAVIEALEAEATHAHTEIERLAGDCRTASATQERLETEVQTVRAEAQATSALLGEVSRELGALREQRTRGIATGREAGAARATLGARVESLSAERDQLRETLAAITAERDGLAAERAEAALARTRVDEALARESAERARLAAALAPLQAAIAAYEAEAVERTTEIEHLRAERAAALTAHAVATAETVVPFPEPLPPPLPAAPEPRMRVVTMAAASGRRLRDSEPVRAVVAVLDADDTWEDLEIPDHRIVVVAPGDEAGARLQELAPTRVIANLATPGTLGTLTALRATGATVRFWGCLATPAADRALAVGMVEPAVRPIDPDAILTALAAYTTRGTRVVTAGADVDSLMSLRQALSRGGMSVSMAWDATQATDLLGVVKPEVVVVDLDLPRREGYSIVARLATLDPVPSAVLIPGGSDAAGAFAAILAQPVYTSRCLGLRDLVARVVGRSEAPPEERPQKVRALTRK